MDDGITMHIIDSAQDLKDDVADRFLRQGSIFSHGFEIACWKQLQDKINFLLIIKKTI